MGLRAACTSQRSPRREGGRFLKEGDLVILSRQTQEARGKTKSSRDVKAMEQRSRAYIRLGPKVGQGRPLVAEATPTAKCPGALCVLDPEGTHWRKPRRREIGSQQSGPKNYTLSPSLSKTLPQPWKFGAGHTFDVPGCAGPSRVAWHPWPAHQTPAAPRQRTMPCA